MPVTKPQSLKQTTAFEENDVLASICRDSFFEFVCEFWEVIEDRPMTHNWHIPYICNELQIVAERVFLGLPKLYDLIINVPPGSTKTIICSIMFGAWIWTRKPSARIIAASHDNNAALKPARKSRTIIMSEKYMNTFPEIHIPYDSVAVGLFRNTLKGIRASIGSGGNITGDHSDFIVVDDLLNPKGARSEAEILEGNLYITETLWSRKTNKAVTPTIYIHQRLSENDTTGMLLKLSKDNPQYKIKHLCFPAMLSEGGRECVHPAECIKYYKDGKLDPVRLSDVVINEAKVQGEYVFKGQYMQNPIPPGGVMFHVERISIDIPPTKWKKKVRFWDKAGTKDGGAYTVGVLMGEDMKRQFWILDVIRGQWDSAQREQVIKQIAYLDGKGILIGIEQEPGSGGKESAENTVRNLAGFSVFVMRPTGDKAQRADPFGVQVNSGNVFLAKAEWNSIYIDELRTFSLLNSKYKDQVDASSGAFNKITGGGTLEIGVFKLYD